MALALPLAAQDWKGATLMDSECSVKEKVMKHPEDHTAHCAKMCAKSGFGIIVDNKFIKFDQKGSDLATEALKKTEKTDHLKVDVTGELKDGVINVSSLTLLE